VKKIAIAVVFLLGATGCQTYKYAHQVKLIAFNDDFTKAESVGNVRGKDCQSFILGYATGPEPSLDRALEDAQEQAGKGHRLRYMNDVATDFEGFDAGVYAKRCLVVKGRGYK
jgi:hypothetical protein